VTAAPIEMIALLGRRDSPTDAVEDYTHCLADALSKKGVALKIVRVPWAEKGWLPSLRWLRQQSGAWNGQWVLVQYTGLAWSRRGLTLGFRFVLSKLKPSGAKIAIVFHDPLPFPGRRLRDRARRWLQEWVMRSAARKSHRNISTISVDRVPWMSDPRVRENLAVIPIGSNIPERWREAPRNDSRTPTVVVFTVTERKESEAAQIARVMRKAAEQLGAVRLIVVGRGAPEAESFLKKFLEGTQVRLDLHGIISPEEVSALLSQAHVQLFVRSGIAARRGSVVAGIASGLPIVGWADAETAFPVTEAGIRAVPLGDEASLVRELVAVLTDSALRAQLQASSRRAAEQHFSWDEIARRFMEALDPARIGATPR
jgi:glycosyltransferase involved in cell wall biosynthesis